MRPATLISLLAALVLAAAAEDALAQNLRPGDTVRGQLQDDQSTNAHLLDLTAGDRVIIKLRGMRSGPAPDLKVTAPDGALLATASGRRVNRVPLRAPLTGSYRLDVTAMPGGALDYMLRIRGRRVAPYTPPPGGNPSPLPPPSQAPGDRTGPTHFYLPGSLLAGERGEDLSRAAEAIDALQNEPARIAIDALGAEIEDEILGAVLAALEESGVADQPLGRAGLERVLDVVDADRRALAAERRRRKLADASAGTRLEGDQAFEAGMSMTAEAIARACDEIQKEIRDSIPAFARGGEAPAPASLDAPELIASGENLAGRRVLERSAMDGLMDQARGGDDEAADLARALYESYARMLAEGAPHAALLRERVEQRLEELRAIQSPAGDPLELEIDSIPVPGPGEAFEVTVRVRDEADQIRVAWSIADPTGLTAEESPEGFRVRGEGETSGRAISVRASCDGREGAIEVYVEAQVERKPLFEVAGRIVDERGLPLAGARVELRAEHPEGEVAETPGGRRLESSSGDDGRFSLPYVEEGTLWLVVSRDGEVRDVREVPAGIPAEIEKLNRIEMEDIRIER